ncbi:MAG: DUF2934 domain-containing protein [Lentisphaeria bacterium]|jgi:hypothetical protein
MKRREELKRLAYELFEKGGRSHGREMEHWLEAERLLRARQEAEQARDVEAAVAKERKELHHERSDARWHEARKTGKG